MSLYNNKKQEKEFSLQHPASTKGKCSQLKVYFPDFSNCESSYILAQPTRDYNCIGWAIGVKKFIDPTKEINEHYSEKLEYKKLVEYNSIFSFFYKLLTYPLSFFGITSKDDDSLSISLYEYTKNNESCMKATKLFFEAYKGSSVLPKKDGYIPTDKISHPPQDDTIAFYFKEGRDIFERNNIDLKGFQHAARYIEDVNSWVSDIWSSKLGPQMLITHEEHELEGGDLW